MYTVAYKRPMQKIGFNKQNPENGKNRQHLNMMPLSNIEVLESGWNIYLGVPGYVKEEVSISLDKELLTIQGEHPVSEHSFVKNEWNAGPFKRSFRLPENADTENIAAEMNNGILTVFIPKKEKRVSKIDIK
ncbi:MAG: Hsp20/alpha crystallin family protein [Saprospiraceae bacterium]|nr:Hsp20/alpha crystallin family protein [Saprospiraceae bacterium]